MVPRGLGRRTCVETARCHPNAAIVVPAVTAARNPVNLRTEPGDRGRGAPAVLRAARRDRLRHAGRGRAPARRRGARSTRSRAVKTSTSLQGLGQRSRHRLRPARARAARRQGLGAGISTTGRRCGRGTARRFLDKWTGDGEVPRLDDVRPGPLRPQPRDRTRRSPVGWTATSRCGIAKIGGCGASSPRTARCARICSVGRTPVGAGCGPAFRPGRESSGRRGPTSRVTALARVVRKRRRRLSSRG